MLICVRLWMESSFAGDSTHKMRAIERGAPQVVLPPLSWNLVMNELLMMLEQYGREAITFAVDIVLVIRDRLHLGLKSVSDWASDRGLGVYPVKTEVVIFMRRNTAFSSTETERNGTETQGRGLILDRKLSWKPNVVNRIKKASIALYACY